MLKSILNFVILSIVLNFGWSQVSGCMDENAYNCEGSLNNDYILWFGTTPFNHLCDGGDYCVDTGSTEICTDAGDESCISNQICSGFYNPDADVDDGSVAFV